MDTPGGFFQVGNQNNYPKMVIIHFVHLEKKHFLFYAQGRGAKIEPAQPLENQTLNGPKSVNSPQIDLVPMGWIEMDKDRTHIRAKYIYFLPQKMRDKNHRMIFLREIFKSVRTV